VSRRERSASFHLFADGLKLHRKRRRSIYRSGEEEDGEGGTGKRNVLHVWPPRRALFISLMILMAGRHASSANAQ
jgi:hypothetical protein